VLLEGKLGGLMEDRTRECVKEMLNLRLYDDLKDVLQKGGAAESNECT
jgi:hypothetical protein